MRWIKIGARKLAAKVEALVAQAREETRHTLAFARMKDEQSSWVGKRSKCIQLLLCNLLVCSSFSLHQHVIMYLHSESDV